MTLGSTSLAKAARSGTELFSRGQTCDMNTLQFNLKFRFSLFGHRVCGVDHGLWNSIWSMLIGMPCAPVVVEQRCLHMLKEPYRSVLFCSPCKSPSIGHQAFDAITLAACPKVTSAWNLVWTPNCGVTLVSQVSFLGTLLLCRSGITRIWKKNVALGRGTLWIISQLFGHYSHCNTVTVTQCGRCK